MKSGFLFLLLIPLAHSDESAVPPSRRHPSTRDGINPLVESDTGAKVIQFWRERQEGQGLPYDVDSCYGWIGANRPKKGDFIGLALTPNCFIIKADLLTFLETYQQTNAEYERFSEDSHDKRDRCNHHHLFITRLHRLDEGGLFTYHYTRVRMEGNKVQVTFFALRDVLEEGQYYNAADVYTHPSVHFYNADKFPLTFEPLLVYTIDYEIYVWFKSSEGLRLYNYRLTWDSTNTDNGFHVDVYQQFAVPNQILPQNRVSYIVTSSEEVHYFFVANNLNEHNVYLLKHTDLINEDFSRMEMLDMHLAVDVYPRAIIRDVLPYYSLGVYHKSLRYNKKCSTGAHAEFYLNQSVREDGTVRNELPPISDPPLALNIFATHFRSAYPFVTSGRNIQSPEYYKMTLPIGLAVLAGLIARWVVIGYDVMPTRMARWLRLRVAKRFFIFKSLASRKEGHFIPLFRFIYRIERLIRSLSKRLYKSVGWMLQIENEEEEETRLLMQAVHTADQPSQRDATTPNE